MTEQRDKLVFYESPEVEIATNTFINVPVILQYDETPLIELGRFAEAGFTTQIRIFHSDGTDLARVKGSRLFLTEAGHKANLSLRYPDRLTVCELDGKTLFEIRRKEAAVLATEAELYTPDGSFVKANNKGIGGRILLDKDQPLTIGGLTMIGCAIQGCRIGIHIRSDGSVGVGVNRVK